MKRNLQPALIQAKQYSKRKVARPLSARGWHHLVLKSGQPILRIHRALIKNCLREAQLRYGIELKALAIMENHIHLCVRIPNQTLFAHFLRVFAGQTSLKIGRGRSWIQRAWTRIVKSGRDLKNVIRYIEGNPVLVGIFDDLDAIHIEKGVLTLRP